MSATPTLERHFAAVRIRYGTSLYHLNRERLTAAIGFVNEQSGSSAEKLRARFPSMTPGDVHEHLAAAVLCIDFDLKP